MKPLSDQDSRKLFVNRIFGSQEAGLDVPEEISADILKKCGGLPLAIISTASLLAHNPRSRWDSVRNSLVSMFEGDQDELKQMERILDLSYRHLPHHLKTCLLDIGRYREDYEIEKDTLLREWVAQGFVSRTRMRDAVDVAEDYFYALINMSMIQPWTMEDDEVETCRVHDIMLDLIRSKAAEENFNLVINGPEVVAGEHKRVRRVSICYDGEQDGAILAAIKGSLSHVRSVLLFRGVTCAFFFGIEVVCSTTGEYVKLPDQIGELQQLETIEVEISDCFLGKPTSLPPDIVRLSRLMHLSYTGSGLVLPDGIGKLRSLRTLQAVDLLESSAENIKGIAELTCLRQLKKCSTFHCYDEKVHKLEWKMRMDALRRLSGNLRSFIMGDDCHIVVPAHD
ncbi:disease resistance protein RGA5-like [Panicum virgatum]|uniref:disease resistance protein RGA5-like n=1 Tax=Panicum virgatum TaxID=38727 RepID=UPI0019D67500|nr:disease resistance protein RGA5-like [Panicum virgatum]